MRPYYLALILICLTACAPDNGANGEHGLDGRDGRDGNPGIDGASCTVTQTEIGVLISCPDGSSGLVLHGRNGDNGKNCEKKNCKTKRHGRD